MLFAHDTEASLAAAAELVNTAHETPDGLRTPADVVAFVDRWSYTGRVAGDAEELAAVRAVRPRLERLWHADRDEVVELTNAMLRETRALPQLVRHDTWDYHLHAVPPEADLAVRILVETGMAMVDVVRLEELGRMRICAAEDCDDVLIDLSKNRSRRFCDNGCGNRTNVAAYRARKAGG
ncbi:CGNR zinc finger domain-containing protein [Cryptosporangium phraense]|uniref:CGNR zinc finger domain-containing protein n=1 Tax=Cryptosporangium phraense TaxID=2593070 RepID=A0A545AM87_9ACTN|nr:CGNR zinc finger domain-containing protein [Cryptosporangium phraense]TQS42370.1 CGNR zinc finger domain-containing protein [Cryptosporangium phraense]